MVYLSVIDMYDADVIYTARSFGKGCGEMDKNRVDVIAGCGSFKNSYNTLDRNKDIEIYKEQKQIQNIMVYMASGRSICIVPLCQKF